MGSRAALITVCGVLALTFLDITIVSVTLGSIQSDLHAGVTSLQWVVNSYSLVFASLMLAAGSLGDRIGRKRVLVAGVVIFCGGSVLAALAPNTTVLIIARVVMGVGAAASEPGTLSVLRQLYPDAAIRARAVAAWAAVAGLALALGPVLGGLLVGTGTWRAVFWFNVALAVLLLLACLRFLPESADPQPTRPDLAGTALGALTLGSGAFAVIGGENSGYFAPWILALFAGCGLSAVALIMVERRSAAPMLDYRLLTRSVNGALFVSFAVYFGIFSIFFFTALYLQEALGYSGPHIALLFTPMAIAIVIGSLAGGRWVAHRGTRAPMSLGCLAAAAGILLSAYFIGPDPGYLALASSLALGRCRLRPRHGPGYISGAHRGATRTLWHGCIGGQHEPSDRGGSRGCRAGVAGQRASHRRPATAPHRIGCAAKFSGNRHRRHQAGQRLRRWQRERYCHLRQHRRQGLSSGLRFFSRWLDDVADRGGDRDPAWRSDRLGHLAWMNSGWVAIPN
jgi:MFS family permease